MPLKEHDPFFSGCRIVRHHKTLNNPADVAKRYSTVAGLDHEVVVAIAMTSIGVPHVERVFHGGTDQASCPVRDVMLTAFKCPRACDIMVIHNHPSGDPTPSENDVQYTRRLAEAAHLLGIVLQDHVILARGGRWYSMNHSMHDVFLVERKYPG